ncbi:MAG: hypothetical protein OXU61_00175 [Gammaproteobacteria bacterium]|nr:hypothetical protein [Gammaproteobacteria bacterium]
MNGGRYWRRRCAPACVAAGGLQAGNAILSGGIRYCKWSGDGVKSRFQRERAGRGAHRPAGCRRAATVN